MTAASTGSTAPGQGLPGLGDGRSLRAWLYRIATNTCLDAIARRPKRVLPVDYAPPADPNGGPGEPIVESYVDAWEWSWRHVRVRANGQEALAFYSWDPEAESYSRFALNVLTLRGARISEVTAFLTRSTQDPDRRVLARLPEQPFDPRRLDAAFERFGLPAQLD